MRLSLNVTLVAALLLLTAHGSEALAIDHHGLAKRSPMPTQTPIVYDDLPIGAHKNTHIPSPEEKRRRKEEVQRDIQATRNRIAEENRNAHDKIGVVQRHPHPMPPPNGEPILYENLSTGAHKNVNIPPRDPKPERKPHVPIRQQQMNPAFKKAHSDGNIWINNIVPRPEESSTTTATTTMATAQTTLTSTTTTVETTSTSAATTTTTTETTTEQTTSTSLPTTTATTETTTEQATSTSAVTMTEQVTSTSAVTTTEQATSTSEASTTATTETTTEETTSTSTETTTATTEAATEQTTYTPAATTTATTEATTEQTTSTFFTTTTATTTSSQSTQPTTSTETSTYNHPAYGRPQSTTSLSSTTMSTQTAEPTIPATCNGHRCMTTTAFTTDIAEPTQPACNGNGCAGNKPKCYGGDCSKKCNGSDCSTENGENDYSMDPKAYKQPTNGHSYSSPSLYGSEEPTEEDIVSTTSGSYNSNSQDQNAFPEYDTQEKSSNTPSSASNSGYTTSSTRDSSIPSTSADDDEPITPRKNKCPPGTHPRRRRVTHKKKCAPKPHATHVAGEYLTGDRTYQQQLVY